MTELAKDFDMNEVAEALGMSARWVRLMVSKGAEHQRYGHKIRFTEAQVEQLRAQHVKAPARTGITTGRKRSA